MEELKEYLKRSKSKRDKSIRRAAKILNASTNKSLTSVVQKPETDFPTVTPKRFHNFEKTLNNQVHSLFYPAKESSSLRKDFTQKFSSKKEIWSYLYKDNSITDNIRSVLNGKNKDLKLSSHISIDRKSVLNSGSKLSKLKLSLHSTTRFGRNLLTSSRNPTLPNFSSKYS
jgi:hypothetical protein